MKLYGFKMYLLPLACFWLLVQYIWVISQVKQVLFVLYGPVVRCMTL
jgi:hypothetical protein